MKPIGSKNVTEHNETNEGFDIIYTKDLKLSKETEGVEGSGHEILIRAGISLDGSHHQPERNL